MTGVRDRVKAPNRKKDAFTRSGRVKASFLRTSCPPTRWHLP